MNSTEERTLAFWNSKILALLKDADTYQLEIIYNFIFALLK